VRLEDPYRCARAVIGLADRPYHIIDHGLSEHPPFRTLCAALVTMRSIALMLTIPDGPTCRPCLNVYRTRMYERTKQQNGAS
jgi:hypothetical protein